MINLIITSRLATLFQIEEQDYSHQTTYFGEVLEGTTLEDIFRMFNRVDNADAVRLEQLGYRMPSLSVGDLVTLGTDTYRVDSVGFTKLDPPKPCGCCHRCAIHDDPGGCLEVEAWTKQTLLGL